MFSIPLCDLWRKRAGAVEVAVSREPARYRRWIGVKRGEVRSKLDKGLIRRLWW